MTEDTDKQPTGFDYRGRFYPWHVTDHGKDLLLIDTFARMPADEFFQLMDGGGLDTGAAPVLLALIATSLRNGNPSWSFEKLERTVMNTPLSDFEFVGDEEEDEQEDDAGPPVQAGPSSTGPQEQPSGSSPSSTGQDDSESETLYAIPA